jgi:hypothetical protein
LSLETFSREPANCKLNWFDVFARRRVLNSQYRKHEGELKGDVSAMTAVDVNPSNARSLISEVCNGNQRQSSVTTIVYARSCNR